MTAEELEWSDSALAPYSELVAGTPQFDEVIGPGGIRDEQQLVSAAVQGMGLSGLLAARAEARRLVDDDGVHYGGAGRNRPWTIDPVPMVVGAQEWHSLEEGVAQRNRVLDLLLADIYGPQRMLREGVIPAEVILGHQDFLHQAHGVGVPDGLHLTLSGTDLGRTADGAWCVMSDRTSAPSGAGYAMVNRRITSRVMADLHRVTRLHRLRGFFTTMRSALHQAAPHEDHAVRGALLWSGSASETAYEQGFLASLLGFSLVEAEDLTVNDGRLWIEDPEGRSRLDVLVRRIDSHYADPLEWRSDSQLGVAGLLTTARLGNLTIANPLGSGVLENPGLLPFLPEVTRRLLGEDQILPSAQTLWCGDRASLDQVVQHVEDLVLKPIHRGRAGGSVPGWTLSSAQREELLARVRQEPWAWVGQEPVHTSTTPVVTREGLVPRRTVLRTFGVATGQGWAIMPGGLARVAADDDSFTVSTMTGALVKDVWVLDSGDALPPLASARPGPEQLWVEGHDPRPLPPRAADNLYWVGRYSERADATNRLLVVALDLSEDFGNRPGTAGHQVMHQVFEAITALTALPADPTVPGHSSRQVLRRAATDPELVGSLAHDVANLHRAAHEVPDRLSEDVWPLLARLQRLMTEAQGSPDFEEIRQATLAFAGITSESMVRDSSWAFLDSGIRLERALNTLWFMGALFTEDLSSGVEGHLVDSLARVCESAMTHHRRAAAGEHPARPLHAAISLLVLDEANPRAVVHLLRRFADDMRLLGDDSCVTAAGELAADLRAHRHTLFSDDTAAALEVLGAAEARLRRLSDDLSTRHFGRSRPRMVTQAQWVTTVPPRPEGDRR